jgi:hypothetical protein
LVTPARIAFAECEIGGGVCNNAQSNYGINVVAAVPEPVTIALLAPGVAALVMARRRRRG